MTQLRKISLSRRDFMQDPAAVISDGVWENDLPLSNVLDMNPQNVAQAISNSDPGSTQFYFDLGYVRYNVGLFFFANLRTSSLGFLDIYTSATDSSVATADYHFSGTTWPQDKVAGGLTPWGEWTLNGVYDGREYSAMGMPRFIVPEIPLTLRYGRVIIRDTTCVEPLQIGCFGVCELYESPNDFGPAPQITIVDGSNVQRSPFGSVFVNKRRIIRRFNFGFPAFFRDEMLAKTFGLSLMKGKSEPLVAITFPDDTESLEKMSVYGLVTNDGVLNNPFFNGWAQPIQIDQL